MADEQLPPADVPPPPPKEEPAPIRQSNPLSDWMVQSGLGGKLLAAGGVLGLILFIYILSRGGRLDVKAILELLGFVGAALASWFIYQGQAGQRKAWLIIALASAGVAGVVATVFFIQSLQFIFTTWALLQFLAAAAAVAGAILAARAAKLF
jgi:hypothetical protein